VERLIQIITTAIDQIPHCTYGVVGIALSIHGVIHQNKIVFIPYSPYQDIDFARELEAHFHIPVCLENEANLFALGEWTYTLKTKNMLAISVHSGIGLGIIMNNQLITGQDGYAGEFGHTIIERGGRPCPCGNGGCLEQYASERSLLKVLSEKKGTRITAERFCELYLKQDKDARDIMNLFVEYMAIGINNLLQTFNPDVMVINSTFTMYFPEICKAISQTLHNDMKRYCHLVPSHFQDTAILLGGVYLCCQKFLEL
jgi:predicted NBD/HSP70 family sugar kinase